MNRLARIVCLMAVLLPLPIAAEDTDIGNNAERELLAASAAWDNAFNTENVDAVMALYADGAVSMPPGFPALIGKPSIQADYEFLFENFDFHHQTTVMQLDIHGTLAVERGEYTMLVAPAGGAAFVETGKHIVVREKINGSWVVIVEAWNLH